MDTLPPESSYRLALLLGRERPQIEDRMVQGARDLSPIYAFMPAFLLRQWGHAVTGAVITALVEADLQPVRSYAAMTIQLAQRVGRPAALLRGLMSTWGGVVGNLIVTEFATEPVVCTESMAILDTMLALAEQAITLAYVSDDVAQELLPTE